MIISITSHILHINQTIRTYLFFSLIKNILDVTHINFPFSDVFTPLCAIEKHSKTEYALIISSFSSVLQLTGTLKC